MQRQCGLTLLELLVVLAIIAISSAGVAIAMRDSAQTQLEREAQRLIAKLEAVRVQSRAQGIPLIWRVADSGFVFETPLLGSDFVALREEWLTAGMTADVSKNSTSGLTGEISPNSKIAKSTGYIVLGPEPIIYPTSIALRLKSVATSASKANTLILRIKTDGIQPFHIAP